MKDLIEQFAKLAKGTFLAEDRTSNFPSENTILNRAQEAAAAEPTDEQLLRTYALALTLVVDDAPKPWPDDLVNRAQIAGLRAVLARWGNYPASPDSSTSP